MNARAEKGSSSDDCLEASTSSSPGSVPFIASTSSGAGKKSITASNTACTPLFLKALPQRAGTISLPIVLILRPSLICSMVSSPDSK